MMSFTLQGLWSDHHVPQWARAVVPRHSFMVVPVDLVVYGLTHAAGVFAQHAGGVIPRVGAEIDAVPGPLAGRWGRAQNVDLDPPREALVEKV